MWHERQLFVHAIFFLWERKYAFIKEKRKKEKKKKRKKKNEKLRVKRFKKRYDKHNIGKEGMSLLLVGKQ